MKTYETDDKKSQSVCATFVCKIANDSTTYNPQNITYTKFHLNLTTIFMSESSVFN